MLRLCEPCTHPLRRCSLGWLFPLQHALPAASVWSWATETWANGPRFHARVWKGLEKPDELPSSSRRYDFVADGLALGLLQLSAGI